MKLKTIMLLALLASMLQGCLFTKLVTVPMRVTGAVVSVVPSAGDTVHDVIDEAAEKVDDLPI